MNSFGRTPRIVSLLILLATPALAAPVPVSGRVAGPGGEALAGARIELLPLAGTAPEPVARALSGPRGTFRLNAPDTGMWTVRVSAEGLAPFETDLVPLVEPAELPAIELRPAARGTAPARREKPPGPRGRPTEVRGVVRDTRSGRGLPGALVWPEGEPAAFVRAGADGAYVLRAAPGRLLAAAAGYQPGSGPGPALSLTPRPLTGRGRVVDASDRPVPGAGVSLLPAGEAGLPEAGSLLRARADRAGRFEVPDLPAGSWDLRVTAPGFAPTVVRGVAVRAGSEDLGTVILQPGAALEGSVTDPDGAPVEGATVRIQSEGLLAMRLAAAGEEEPKATTGADGGFRLPGLAPGEPVALQVWKRGYEPTPVPASLPGAEPVAVVLRPAPRVAGRVLDEDGAPVAGARVVLLAETPDGKPGRIWSSEPADEEGRFAVEGVVPGRAKLTAMAQGLLPPEPRPLEVPRAGLEGLEITLERGAVVEGRVLDAGGRPVAGARLRIAAPPQAGPLPPLGLAEAQTDADGSYRLDGVPSGRRTVTAEHPDHPPASAELEVGPGTNPLDFRLESGWEVSGRVVDGAGRPVAGARVTVSSRTSTRQAVSGPDGGFRVTAVGEGRHRIEAERQGFAPARPAADLQVAGGPVSGIELRLDRGGAIAGRILGLPYEELSRVEVWVSGPGGGAVGRVDPAGTYRADNLPPGEWTVTARVNGREAHGRVTLEPGVAETVLDLGFGSDGS